MGVHWKMMAGVNGRLHNVMLPYETDAVGDEHERKAALFAYGALVADGLLEEGARLDKVSAAAPDGWKAWGAWIGDDEAAIVYTKMSDVKMHETEDRPASMHPLRGEILDVLDTIMVLVNRGNLRVPRTVSAAATKQINKELDKAREILRKAGK